MKKQQEAFDKLVDEKYIPLEKKYKIVILIALLIIPVVLFYFISFDPKMKTQKSLDGKRVKLEKELREAKKQAANKEKFEKQFQKTQERFLETADMLPSEKEIPQLLKDISALGQNAGLDFLSFKPGKDKPKDFYAEIPININVRGPYHNMGFFLDQVSKLDRIVTVSNIKLSSPKKVRGEMLLKSTCNLVTYRFTNKPLQKKKKTKKKRR